MAACCHSRFQNSTSVPGKDCALPMPTKAASPGTIRANSRLFFDPSPPSTLSSVAADLHISVPNSCEKFLLRLLTGPLDYLHLTQLQRPVLHLYPPASRYRGSRTFFFSEQRGCAGEKHSRVFWGLIFWGRKSPWVWKASASPRRVWLWLYRMGLWLGGNWTQMTHNSGMGRRPVRKNHCWANRKVGPHQYQ